MDLGAFLLILGAGARTSFLLTDDSITQGARERLAFRRAVSEGARQATFADPDATPAQRRRAAFTARWWWAANEWFTCAWCNSPWFMALWLAWWALAPTSACFTYPAAVFSASLLWALAYGLHGRALAPSAGPQAPLGPRRRTNTTTT